MTYAYKKTYLTLKEVQTAVIFLSCIMYHFYGLIGICYGYTPTHPPHHPHHPDGIPDIYGCLDDMGAVYKTLLWTLSLSCSTAVTIIALVAYKWKPSLTTCHLFQTCMTPIVLTTHNICGTEMLLCLRS